MPCVLLFEIPGHEFYLFTKQAQDFEQADLLKTR